MNGVKRLTPPQSRKVNALVRRTCCNYDNGNCILLDDGDECVCPQLISYSLLCKWFRAAVPHVLNNPWLNYSVYLSNTIIPGILMLLIFMTTVYTIGSEMKTNMLLYT